MEGLGERIKAFLSKTGRHFKENRRSLVTDCVNPNCQKEMHLYIQKSDGRTKCMKCGTGWSIVGFIAVLEGISRVEAEKIVFGVNVPEQRENLNPGLKTDQYSKELTDADFEVENAPVFNPIVLDPLFIPVEKSEVGMAYLKSRGIEDLDLIHSFDIRYSAVMNGVVFPVYLNGACLGWQCRFVEPRGKLRMLSFPGMPKTRILLNIDKAKSEKNLILVEGPFDCLKTNLPGYGSVASFGKEVSEDQLNLIRLAKPDRLYLGLDRDAFKEVCDLAERLGDGTKLFRLLPPEGRKDLGECSKEEILAALEGAPEVSREHISRLEVDLR